jgi:hypothetical protein
MSKNLKIILISSIVVMLIMTITAINLLLKSNHLSKELVIEKNASDSLTNKMEYLNKKELADDLFINGNYDEALALYSEISEEYSLANLYNERLNLIPQTEYNNNDSTVIITIEDKAKIKELQELFDFQLKCNDSTFNVKVDSLENLYNEKISELEKDLIAEKNKEKSSKISKLNFQSLNGTKILYLGEVKNSKANGKGMGHYASGSLYLGDWKDNLKHDSKGYYKWSNGDWYEGDFELDKRTGKGTYHWANGERYEGEWLNDKRNGKGTLYGKDNKVILDGTWSNDEFVK